MDFNSLNHWQQLAVCAAMTERSFPNYGLYCELAQTGEPKTVRKMLNKVWEYLRGQLKSLKNIESQLEQLEPLIPDVESTENYGAFLAMDVTVALQSCLQSILDNSILDADAITTMMRERLQEVLEMQEAEVNSHELWQRHSEFEQTLFDLMGLNISHAEAIKKLIPLASDEGVSHIGITLNNDDE